MLLTLARLLTPAWVLVVTALAGVVRPNDLVMRNTLIGETITSAHLMGALGMSRATSGSARVGGALAGAGLSTALGLGATYVVVTSVYLASLALVRQAGVQSATSPDGGGAEAIVDALVEGRGGHRLGTGQVRASPQAKRRLGLHEPQSQPAPLSRLWAELAAQRGRERVAESQPAHALRPFLCVRL